MRNIVFSNIDLIHVEGEESTFSIHNGDRAIVDNVLYENIRVEDAQGLLVDFKILESSYSKDKERGKIQNIVFRNIFVDGYAGRGSVMEGYNETHMIKNVLLSNFNVNGKRITSPAGLKLSPRFTSGLKFNSFENKVHSTNKL